MDSEGKDVGARDGVEASCLKGDFDLIDNLESLEGVQVGVGPLLTDYAAIVV